MMLAFSQRRNDVMTIALSSQRYAGIEDVHKINTIIYYYRTCTVKYRESSRHRIACRDEWYPYVKDILGSERCPLLKG